MHQDFDLGTWTFDRAKAFVSTLRVQRHKFALTNGCFELFHYGHSEFLKECRRQIPYGETLIVAVNSDSSFEQLKRRRPLIHEHFRRSVVAAHMSVGMAFLWDSLRVTEIIRVLEPDWWFKGGDYTMETLDQSEVAAAKEAGTEIKILDHIRGMSTSKIVDHIRKTGVQGAPVGT